MASASAAVEQEQEQEPMELEVEVAAVLRDLKPILRARDRRRKRRQRRSGEIPPWGGRRIRSVLEDGSKPAAAGVAERHERGATSPDTPLAFPESIPEEDDAARKARAQKEEAARKAKAQKDEAARKAKAHKDEAARKARAQKEEAARKAREQEEWMEKQRGVVAALSKQNENLLKQIKKYRARLLRSWNANESLKQQRWAKQQRELEEQARMMRTNGSLDPNAPANNAEEVAAKAKAMAAAQERYCQAHQQHLQNAATTSEARRRRMETLRAKAAAR